MRWTKYLKPSSLKMIKRKCRQICISYLELKEFLNTHFLRNLKLKIVKFDKKSIHRFMSKYLSQANNKITINFSKLSKN